MGFVDWYARDTAYDTRNALLPKLPRGAVVEELVRNLDGGMQLLRVVKTEGLHRLLLLERCEAMRGSLGAVVYWCMRPFVPYAHYWERVALMVFEEQKIAYSDPFREVPGHGFNSRVHGARLLPDHVRLLVMFSRWRNRCRARAAALRLCFLALEQAQVLRVLIGMGL